MDKPTIIDLQEFILFAKAEKIPAFKMGNFECTLPHDDKELAALRQELNEVKAICNRLILALEMKQGPNPTPFRTRINAASQNG